MINTAIRATKKASAAELDQLKSTTAELRQRVVVAEAEIKQKAQLLAENEDEMQKALTALESTQTSEDVKLLELKLATAEKDKLDALEREQLVTTEAVPALRACKASLKTIQQQFDDVTTERDVLQAAHDEQKKIHEQCLQRLQQLTDDLHQVTAARDALQDKQKLAEERAKKSASLMGELSQRCQELTTVAETDRQRHRDEISKLQVELAIASTKLHGFEQRNSKRRRLEERVISITATQADSRAQRLAHENALLQKQLAEAKVTINQLRIENIKLSL